MQQERDEDEERISWSKRKNIQSLWDEYETGYTYTQCVRFIVRSSVRHVAVSPLKPRASKQASSIFRSIPSTVRYKLARHPRYTPELVVEIKFCPRHCSNIMREIFQTSRWLHRRVVGGDSQEWGLVAHHRIYYSTVWNGNNVGPMVFNFRAVESWRETISKYISADRYGSMEMWKK